MRGSQPWIMEEPSGACWQAGKPAEARWRASAHADEDPISGTLCERSAGWDGPENGKKPMHLKELFEYEVIRVFQVGAKICGREQGPLFIQIIFLLFVLCFPALTFL